MWIPLSMLFSRLFSLCPISATRKPFSPLYSQVYIAFNSFSYHYIQWLGLWSVLASKISKLTACQNNFLHCFITPVNWTLIFMYMAYIRMTDLRWHPSKGFSTTSWWRWYIALSANPWKCSVTTRKAVHCVHSYSWFCESYVVNLALHLYIFYILTHFF